MPDLEVVLSRDEFVQLQGGLSLLRNLNMPYAVSGAIALSQYAPARFTYDIDVLVRQDNYDQAITWASELLLQKDSSTRGRVGIKIVRAQRTPELLALKNAVNTNILGIRVKVVPPDLLLWIYCGSKELQHLSDAIELLHANPSFENGTRTNVANYPIENAALSRIIDGVRLREQSSYSESVRKRLSDLNRCGS